MVTVTTEVSIRPSTSVEFYAWPNDFREYVTETYSKTGKHLMMRTEISPDLLTKTTVSRWTDQGWDEFINDPDPRFVEWYRQKLDYNEENGIMTRSMVKVIDL